MGTFFFLSAHRWVTLFPNVMTKQDEPFITRPFTDFPAQPSFSHGNGTTGIVSLQGEGHTRDGKLSPPYPNHPLRKWEDPGLPRLLIGGFNLFMLFQAELEQAGKKKKLAWFEMWVHGKTDLESPLASPSLDTNCWDLESKAPMMGLAGAGLCTPFFPGDGK